MSEEKKPQVDVEKKVPEKTEIPAEELGGVAGGMSITGIPHVTFPGTKNEDSHT